MDRVGIGQDSHRFTTNKPLILGGDSDGDVILHSLCNALSSAMGGDSLSTWSDNMCQKGIKDSKKYVETIFAKVKVQQYKVQNVSISMEAKKPFIELEAAAKMKKTIADLLGIGNGQVGITFTSGEGLTPFGKGLGVQAICIVLLSHD